MHAQRILSQLPFQLTDTFQIRQGLDVTYRASDFCNYKVELILVAQQLDVTLDFIRDVGNDLNGFSQIVSTAFFINDALIDTACRDIVGLCSLDAQETFVVS